MKILHVVQNYHPSVGGTQLLFKQLSEKLVKDYKDEVTVFTTNSYYGPHKKEFKEIEIDCETINGVRIQRFHFYRFLNKLIDIFFIFSKKVSIPISEKLIALRTGPWSPSLKRQIQNGNFDIVCASSSHYLYMNYPLWRYKSGKPKPFVFMGALHLEQLPENDFIPKKLLKSIQLSDAYIANTSFEKKRLVKLGISDAQINVVGCGVDVHKFETNEAVAFKKKNQIENKLVIGFFGRQEKTKGIPILLRAFETLAKDNDDIVLLIAGGETKYTTEMKHTIASFPSNIKSRCLCVSNVDENEKKDIFNAIDIFVSVSQAESFGIVFLEAWACKKPVIGANIGAVASVISHGYDGYLINANDVNDLTSHLQKLISNEQIRVEMGQNGYKKVNENYTWDIVTNKYRSIYSEAVKNFYV